LRAARNATIDYNLKQQVDRPLTRLPVRDHQIATDAFKGEEHGPGTDDFAGGSHGDDGNGLR
jgi:hypothetical protein